MNYPDDIRQYDDDYRSPLYDSVATAECKSCGWEDDYEKTGLCDKTGLEQCPECQSTNIHIERHII